MPVNFTIPELGNKFQDYRQDIPGDSFNWGPVIQANKVKYFALHHSVTAQTAKNDGNWKKECDLIANLHINQGWGGVGYRFIICSDGTVAYVGDLSHGGSAVTGNNDTIFSACFVGDFTKELPTAAQVHSAHILSNHIINNMPQYPLIAGWDNLIGHKDAKALLNLPGATATACPGTNWRDANDPLRGRVISDNFNGYPNPQPVGIPVPPQESVESLKKKIEEQQVAISTLNTTLINEVNNRKSLANQALQQLSEANQKLLVVAETIKKLNS